MSPRSSLWKSGLIVFRFCAVLLLGAGCQSFRTSQYTPSESDKERDQKVGEVVETGGTLLYWVLQSLPWIH